MLNIKPSQKKLQISAVLAWAIAFGQLSAVAGLATPSVAFAQGPLPDTPKPETLTGSPLLSRDNISEARNGNPNTLCRVWRGETDSQVWVSINGDTFRITAGTQTNVRPSVVAYGDHQFMVIHVGVDERVYYSIVDFNNGNPTNTGWESITAANTTRLPVGATQLGAGTDAVFVAITGTDGRVYGTSFVGLGGWQPLRRLQDGQALAGPSAAYNPSNEQIFVAVAGTDNDLWLSHEPLGTETWGAPWVNQGVVAINTPGIAVDPNTGTMMLSVLDGGLRPWFAYYNNQGQRQGNWGVNGQITNTISAAHITGLAITFFGAFWALWNADNSRNYYGKVR
jgi:hypothetical protein